MFYLIDNPNFFNAMHSAYIDWKGALFWVFYRCPRYSSLPAQCKLIPDFRNPCCKVPDCGFDGTLTSITGQNTLAPQLPGQPTPTPNPLNPNPTPNMGVPVLSEFNLTN